MRAIATVGFIGTVPVAPGTIGSAAALPMAWAVHGVWGFPGLALATVVVTLLGVWAIARTPGGVDDPGEIVIDEVAGQWLALWPLSAGLWHAGAEAWVFPWPGWVGAFLAFRLFDIWKPGPVARAERVGGAWGVMADDLVAGAFAAIAVALAAAIAHGVMGV